MNEYVKWLKNKIEQTLEDGSLGREHWAFCQCLKKLRELGLIDLIKVQITTDESGQWYAIPNELEDEFNLDLENEDLTDTAEFDDKYGRYGAGGDLNLIQLWASV